MSIAEQLQRKFKRAQYVAFAFWAVLVATIVLPNTAAYSSLRFFCVLGFGACVAYLFLTIRCPKCGASLAGLSMKLKGNISERLEECSCSGCGIHLSSKAEL